MPKQYDREFRRSIYERLVARRTGEQPLRRERVSPDQG